jgi:hypothetical protein
MRALILTVILGVCLAAGPAVGGQAGPSGAKALFYTGHGTSHMTSEGPPSVAAPMQATAPPPAMQAADTKAGYMGVSYWIELTGRDGSKQRVTTDRVFRSGDRIKLTLTANRPGYLYLLNIGSSGRSRMLYPHARMRPEENYIQANTAVEVPQGGAIRFDDTVGEETLLLMLSPQPMTDVLPGSGGGQASAAPPAPPAYAPPAASSAYPPPPPAAPAASGYTPEETNRFMMVANSKGAKDLVLETDSASAQPASYAVAPMSSLGDSGMITLQIKLKHR